MNKLKNGNKRWDLDGELGNLPAKRTRRPSVHAEVEEEVEEILDLAEDTPHWGQTLGEAQSMSHKTSGYLLDYSWAKLGTQDHEITLSTLELVKIYAPFLVPVLRMSVSGD